MPPSYPFSTGLRIVGTRQALEIATVFKNNKPPHTVVTVYPGHGKQQILHIEPRDPYVTECQYFIDCIRGKANPSLLSAERAIEALRLTLATKLSLQQKELVSF